MAKIYTDDEKARIDELHKEMNDIITKYGGFENVPKHAGEPFWALNNELRALMADHG